MVSFLFISVCMMDAFTYLFEFSLQTKIHAMKSSKIIPNSVERL